MTEILLSRQTMTARSALLQCQAEGGTIADRLMRNTDNVRPYTPYLISEQPTDQDWRIANHLYSGNSIRELAELSSEVGSDNVIALAILQERIANFSVSAAGAGAGTFNGRVSDFEVALGNYQRALLSYRQTARTGAPTMIYKRTEARRAFEHLQTTFQNELRTITAEVRSRRGTPLTNFNRGLNIARDSRHADKLYVQNNAQAQQLVRFASHAKVLTRGLVAIDITSRAGEVHTTYKADGDWHRETLVQSAGFTAGFVAGSYAVGTGLALAVSLTPVGWVAIVVVAAGTAMAADHLASRVVGSMYDTIVAWLD